MAQLKLPSVMAEFRGIKKGMHPDEVLWPAFKTKYIEWAKSVKKPFTVYRDSYAFKFIEEEFPIMRLGELTPSFLESLQSKLKNKGFSNVNTNRIIRSIKTAIVKAEQWKLIAPQNWKVIKKLKEPKGRIIYYTPGECSQLLQVCHGAWKTVAMLGLRLGLRRGEIFMMPWEHIDFDRSLVHVAPHGEWIPKDHESRAIPMPEDLKAHLKPLRRAQGLVLGGEIASLDVMSTHFRNLLSKAKLPGSLHCLRHTYASHLVQAGVSLYVVSKLLGHSNTAMTQVYAHLAPNNFEDAAALLPTIQPGIMVPTI